MITAIPSMQKWRSIPGTRHHNTNKSWSATVQQKAVSHRTWVGCGKLQRSVRLRVQADLRGVLENAVTYGAVSASTVATLYTVFYDWRSTAGRQPKEPAPLTHPDDNFTWGVMGGISCFPLFNFMAWVLGALQSDTPRPYYWAAALYALPLLRNGFDQDWFSVTMLLLGAAHVQALRIAATEPETQARLQQQLRPLTVVQTVVNTAGAAVATAVGAGDSNNGRSQPQQLKPGDNSSGIGSVLGGSSGNEQDQDELLRQLELEEFDRRLDSKARNKS